MCDGSPLPAPSIGDGVPDGQSRRPVALVVGCDLGGRRITDRLDPYYQIIATTNLPVAIGVLRAVRIDVVLVDPALPDPMTLELITQVRVFRWLPRLPIICYGAAGTDADVSQLVRLAAHDVVVEPVDTDELVARIAAVLAAAR
jgi:DNA-binding response OmpR family regulator